MPPLIRLIIPLMAPSVPLELAESRTFLKVPFSASGSAVRLSLTIFWNSLFFSAWLIPGRLVTSVARRRDSASFLCSPADRLDREDLNDSRSRFRV
ncbi:hypothetical protein CUR86_18940 [Salinicola acroporae]|uniref:Secreted protein n=1 Tax=Salinicola acroporae TaxID=1541440 RepID=A0ABT6IA81_9GAMM|nr:hypothetical protein [Salinicola acroporae]